MVNSISLKLDGMNWSETAEVSYTSPSLDGGLPDGFWPAEREFVCVSPTLSRRDSTWRCMLRVDFNMAERTALPELAALSDARLISLVIYESVAGYLLHTHVALPVLRSLHADECVVRQGSVSVRGRRVGLSALGWPR